MHAERLARCNDAETESRASGFRCRSPRVVEDHAQRVTLPGSHAADAVAEVDAIDPARATHGALVHGKDHGIPPSERHDLDARLHARPLLGQHELAAGELLAGLRQQARNLKRKDMLAIQILVQAVVVVRTVAEEQRRRPGLTGGMAPAKSACRSG